MSSFKKLAKIILCRLFERQVKQLKAKHNFMTIAVAGSVGKTSTKLAIAELLKPHRRVRYQSGNYNDRLTVPFVYFGQTQPSLFNVAAYWRIYMDNRRQIRGKFPYDIVVLELGTDGPGQLIHQAYVKPDIAVVTAITDEHMEYFKNLDAVANEEMTVAVYSKQLLLNIDDIPARYLPSNEFKTYGTSPKADFKLTASKMVGLEGQILHISTPAHQYQDRINLIGAQGAKIALGAAAAAEMAGLNKVEITDGLHALKAYAGRMQLLNGVKDSIIIDDTYNASPHATIAALDVLQNAKAPQRIALLGNMNELGDHSPLSHKQIGDYCDPGKLDLVVTLGPDANKYLSKAAAEKGCQVETTQSPYEAAEIIKHRLQPGGVILAKGSQNRVFAEEAVKHLLANPADESKLVRQSEYWLKLKSRQFQPKSES